MNSYPVSTVPAWLQAGLEATGTMRVSGTIWAYQIDGRVYAYTTMYGGGRTAIDPRKL